MKSTYRLLTTAIALFLAGSASISAQFVSFSAGTEGMNISFANAYPYYTPAVVIAPPPPPPHHHSHHHHHKKVHVPMLPGWDYPVISHKHYRKVVREYEVVEYDNQASGVISFPGGGGIMLSIPIGGGHDRGHHHSDWRPNHHKHSKKAHKRFEREHRRHDRHHGRKHHHGHDDD